jgi:hypothetical protein
MSKTTQATVRILISHDYCHFEISKTIQGDDVSNGFQNDLTQKDIDDARKDCQRLADKAVGQYKKAKAEASNKLAYSSERVNLEREVREIKLKDEKEWSHLDKAKVKALEDYNQDWRYDYTDDEDYTL